MDKREHFRIVASKNQSLEICRADSLVIKYMNRNEDDAEYQGLGSYLESWNEKDFEILEASDPVWKPAKFRGELVGHLNKKRNRIYLSGTLCKAIYMGTPYTELYLDHLRRICNPK